MGCGEAVAPAPGVPDPPVGGVPCRGGVSTLVRGRLGPRVGGGSGITLGRFAIFSSSVSVSSIYNNKQNVTTKIKRFLHQKQRLLP